MLLFLKDFKRHLMKNWASSCNTYGKLLFVLDLREIVKICLVLYPISALFLGTMGPFFLHLNGRGCACVPLISPTKNSTRWKNALILMDVEKLELVRRKKTCSTLFSRDDLNSIPKHKKHIFPMDQRPARNEWSWKWVLSRRNAVLKCFLGTE